MIAHQMLIFTDCLCYRMWRHLTCLFMTLTNWNSISSRLGQAIHSVWLMKLLTSCKSAWENWKQNSLSAEQLLVMFSWVVWAQLRCDGIYACN